MPTGSCQRERAGVVLVARGKSRMVAVGAAMRKLLMIAYGVLKSRRAFSLEPAQQPS